MFEVPLSRLSKRFVLKQLETYQAHWHKSEDKVLLATEDTPIEGVRALLDAAGFETLECRAPGAVHVFSRSRTPPYRLEYTTR